MPRKARSENVLGRRVLLRGVEVDVLAGVRRVGAGDLRLGALAGELGLHPHAAARGAEADRDPVELGVARHLGALGAEDPRLLVEVLAADVAQPGVLPDDELDDGVEQRLGLGVGGEVLLPHLGLGALVEHDQHAALQRAAGRGGDGAEQDRRLDAHAARHVDERAAGPAGVVGRDEDVVLGGDDRAEVRLDQLGVLARGVGQRHDDRRRRRSPRRPRSRRRPGSGRIGSGGSNSGSGSASSASAGAGPKASRSSLPRSVNSQPAAPLKRGRSSVPLKEAARSRRAASHSGS